MKHPRPTPPTPALLLCALLCGLAASACTSGGGKGKTSPEQQTQGAVWDESSWNDADWS